MSSTLAERGVVCGRDMIEEAARAAAVAALRTARTLLRKRLPGRVYPMPGHVGSPAVALDVLAHTAAERAVYDLVREHVVVIGEEARRSVYVEPGQHVFVVDPVDGTGPATQLGFGWSSVVMAWEKLEADDWALSTAAVATSDDRLVSLAPDGRVRVGSLDDDGEVIRLGAREPGAGIQSVATVGAKPGARPRFSALAQSLADVPVYNLGGTPLVAALLELDLAAIVHPERSTPWDAADVLLAAGAGASVATLDGALCDPEDVRGWFARPPIDEDQKTIPPCVTSENPGLAHDLACLLAKS